MSKSTVSIRAEQPKKTTFRIERGIEIPKARASRVIYPFRQMKVNESFFVPEEKDRRKRQLSIVASAQQHKPKAFRTRQEPGGVRCWRIA